MEKKIVFLVGCLFLMLFCAAPQMVSAYDHTDDYDEELVIDSGEEEPEFDDDEEFDEDEGSEQDGEEEGADEEGYDERY